MRNRTWAFVGGKEFGGREEGMFPHRPPPTNRIHSKETSPGSVVGGYQPGSHQDESFLQTLPDLTKYRQATRPLEFRTHSSPHSRHQKFDERTGGWPWEQPIRLFGETALIITAAVFIILTCHLSSVCSSAAPTPPPPLLCCCPVLSCAVLSCFRTTRVAAGHWRGCPHVW